MSRTIKVLLEFQVELLKFALQLPTQLAHGRTGAALARSPHTLFEQRRQVYARKVRTRFLKSVPVAL